MILWGISVFVFSMIFASLLTSSYEREIKELKLELLKQKINKKWK